jgi:hypothetical protein
MQVEAYPLSGDSPGSDRRLVAYRYGQAGQGKKVYLQAGLHADEMPGVLVLQHLMGLLDRAEAQGFIAGEVLVVPAANPIGLGQWVFQRPLGRFDADTTHNFNRGYPELAQLSGDLLEGRLTMSEAENIRIVRQAFAEALAKLETRTDMQEMRNALLGWSHDADYVLDLHCDHHSVMHLYASPTRPADTSLLCRCVGAVLALVQEVSGGNAFDEAHSAPWAALQRRFAGRFPIPPGCFSTTLEYRGQFDVDDATAASDARGLMTFLAAIGVISNWDTLPAFEDAAHYPLGGAIEVFAPQGGVVTWDVQPGDTVKTRDILGHVTDPVTRDRAAFRAGTDGMMFRQELWPSCLRGQGLGHVAGPKALGEGKILGD